MTQPISLHGRSVNLQVDFGGQPEPGVAFQRALRAVELLTDDEHPLPSCSKAADASPWEELRRRLRDTRDTIHTSLWTEQNGVDVGDDFVVMFPDPRLRVTEPCWDILIVVT